MTLPVVKNENGAIIFGQRLRELRKAKKMSQQQLAFEAEVERSTIKRIEFALASPTLDVLISISRALGLDVRDLMDDDAITRSDPK